MVPWWGSHRIKGGEVPVNRLSRPFNRLLARLGLARLILVADMEFLPA
jgi:hypothetical protein